MQPASSAWGFIGGVGFTTFNDMMQSDGTTILGRLALTRKVLRYDNIDWGLELGAQLGNQARSNFTDAQLAPLGGVPVQITIKPGLDLLATAKKPLGKAYPVSLLFKLGFMYRQMSTDRDTISDLKRINPELQVGFAKEIGKQTSLELTYQGIYSSNMTLTTEGALGAGVGGLSNIPTQNGLLFTFHWIA